MHRGTGADFEDVACLSISKNMVAAAMVVWFTGSLAHLEAPMLLGRKELVPQTLSRWAGSC